MSGPMSGLGVATACQGWPVITLDGEPLDLRTVVAIADGEPVRLGAAGRQRAAATHALAVRISAERTVYGRTTGVGANKDSAVAASASAEHAQRLLHSHATSAGPLRDARRVRATMAIRSTSWRPAEAGPGPRSSTGWPPSSRFGLRRRCASTAASGPATWASWPPSPSRSPT